MMKEDDHVCQAKTKRRISILWTQCGC